MALLNDFKIGADPEFAIVNGEHAIRFTGRMDRLAPWGVDHGGWVIEPHPQPDVSVRAVIRNLKIAMNDFATVAPTGKWVAGPHFSAEERGIPMGGHVHMDKPTCSQGQARALDLFATHLEKLDLYPKDALERRQMEGYGRKGDIRTEHGHFEYRSMPSWLFSQRVTKISLIGAKLVAVDTDAPSDVLGDAVTASKSKLKKLFERFHGRDDDADWLLSSGVLDMKLKVDPSRDLKEVWRVRPEKEDPNWKRVVAQAAVVADHPGWNGPTETITVQHALTRYRFRVDRDENTVRMRAVIRNYIQRMPMIRGIFYRSEGQIFQFLGIVGEEF